MRKIAIIATHIGVINRGAETFVIELVKRLKYNYDIDVFAKNFNEDIRENIKKIDFKLPLWLKIHGKLYYSIKMYKKVCDKIYYIIPSEIEQHLFTKKVYKTHLQQNNYDLIFPNNGICGVRYAEKIREKYGTPFIYTGHGGIGKGEELILKTNPNMYIALTRDHFRWSKNYCKNVVTVNNGIDCSSFKCDELKSKNFKCNTVLSVGALTEFKRHKLTIDAVALINDVKLLILGKGEMYEELLKYGKKILGERFDIKSVSYNDMKYYYEKATVFALPSKNEPFGIVYLEAMAMNLPVIAPNDNSRKEIIGEAGVLCDCENAEEYSSAIKYAMALKWGQKPREQALKFDWSIIAKKYSGILEGVIQDVGKADKFEE